MPRIILIAAAAVILAVAGFVFVPPLWVGYVEGQACQAVIDQLRRQIDNPSSSDFEPCEAMTILPGEDGTFFVSGYFEQNGDRFLFAGDAWRAGGGWEATAEASRVIVPAGTK